MCIRDRGIAVGMATNIPPHNLREIVNGMVALMADPDIDLAGLLFLVDGKADGLCPRLIVDNFPTFHLSLIHICLARSLDGGVIDTDDVVHGVVHNAQEAEQHQHRQQHGQAAAHGVKAVLLLELDVYKRQP